MAELVLLSVQVFSVDNSTSWGPKRPHKYNVFSNIAKRPHKLLWCHYQ